MKFSAISLLFLSFTVARAQTCKLHVYRPKVQNGGAVRLGVLVDGVKLANLKGGEDAVLSLPCGRHVFSMPHLPGIQIPINLSEQATVTLRYDRPWGWTVTGSIEQVSEERAIAETSHSQRSSTGSQ